MSTPQNRSGVIARLTMRYNMAPLEAIDFARNWVAAEDGRTWEQLEANLDSGLICVDSTDVELTSTQHNATLQPNTTSPTPKLARQAFYFMGRVAYR